MNSTAAETARQPSYLSWGVIVFLVLFASLSVAWISLRSGPGELERIKEETAVGDLDFFVPPKDLHKDQLMGRHQGKALKWSGAEPSELDPGKLYRVGQLDQSQAWIYTVREHAGKPANQAPVLYLKVGPAKFLRLNAPDPAP